MNGRLIGYKTSPEGAEENQQLIEKVFAELQAKSPKDIRYMALRLGDGAFVHFMVDTGKGASAMRGLEAFRLFQSGIKARCIEPPQADEATVVGNYRMLRE